MALSITNIQRDVSGKYRRNFVTITGDTSYPTGGYAVTPAQFGLHAIVAIDTNVVINSTPVCRDVAYVPSTGKIALFQSTQAEVTATNDVSGFSATIEVIGN